MKKLFSTSLLILAGMLLLLGSCKEDELPVSGEGNVANNELPVRLAETDYNPDNTYYLLNDNESQDVYFDSGQRSFYVSRPLQFGMDDEHCFQLRFYSPRALKNVTFWARIDGYEEEFKFMSLEKIMPFQQLRVHIPFATKDLTAYTRSGKKIRIMANPYLTEENLTFTVECDDPYWASQLPKMISQGLLDFTSNPILILLIMNVVLLIVGMFMDLTPAVLIFTPIFLPIAIQLGIDPVHFGIIMMFNLCIGITTPPVGAALFVGCSISGVHIEAATKKLLPFFISTIVALALVTYVPAFSLTIPRLAGLIN